MVLLQIFCHKKETGKAKKEKPKRIPKTLHSSPSSIVNIKCIFVSEGIMPVNVTLKILEVILV